MIIYYETKLITLLEHTVLSPKSLHKSLLSCWLYYKINLENNCFGIIFMIIYYETKLITLL